MSQPTNYRGYRFPPDIIRHAVWLYFRFGVSFRDVEDLLAERGVTVTHEAIRQWCLTFGLDDERRLRRRRGRMGDSWHLDEVFVKIRGPLHYVWRAVDEDGDVIDILVQSRRNRRAAERFFRKLLKGQGREPRRLITDKLRSYGRVVNKIMRLAGGTTSVVPRDARGSAPNQSRRLPTVETRECCPCPDDSARRIGPYGIHGSSVPGANPTFPPRSRR